MHSPAQGTLLIADPFLKDPNFSRTVVILCEYKEEGTIGFVVNRLAGQTLDELIPELTFEKIPVHYGGPVQLDTIHFLHQSPELIEDGVEIIKGIYWGGNFEKAIQLINEGKLAHDQIRFFIGYSGWSKQQLEAELNEKSWILSRASTGLIFKLDEDFIWKESLRKLGDNFAIMANFPLDPSLN